MANAGDIGEGSTLYDLRAPTIWVTRVSRNVSNDFGLSVARCRRRRVSLQLIRVGVRTNSVCDDVYVAQRSSIPAVTDRCIATAAGALTVILI
ncbi:hypothetical protein EVAR_47409_1 [Eumeta japonica]|uniref:Uncharacterized protein n=1 Tax=Eumeta variegata TaxID=151549 RepID=A0A4C1Y2B6_EUMVA|nr:hypothetical protein EVAR_47409_1 [Eumeta japonica]